MIENTKTYNGHTYSGNLLVACQNGYQQGRADAIKDALNKVFALKNECPDGCHCADNQEYCPYDSCNDDVIDILVRLKEQKNDSSRID